MKVACKLDTSGAIIRSWPLGYEPDNEDTIEADLESIVLADEYGELLYELVDGIVKRRESVRSKELGELAELEVWLDKTDKLAVREKETGKPMPKGLAEDREKARMRISELREKWDLSVDWSYPKAV